MNHIEIDKLDAAEEQISAAVKLFFQEGYHVSVHTLSWAALGIMHDLLNDSDSLDGVSFLHKKSELVKAELGDDWVRQTRLAANFFKHSDKDMKIGRKAIGFNPDFNELVIYEAIRILLHLDPVKCNRTGISLFLIWFLFKHSETKSSHDDELKSVKDLILAEQSRLGVECAHDKAFFAQMLDRFLEQAA